MKKCGKSEDEQEMVCDGIMTVKVFSKMEYEIKGGDTTVCDIY